MQQFSRTLCRVLKLIIWRFKKKKYCNFSWNQNTANLAISSEESHCILSCSSKDIKKSRKQEKASAQPYEYTPFRIFKNLIFFVKKYRIYIPLSLRQRQKVISWYHEYLLYPGQTRTEKNIKNSMTWPSIRQDIKYRLFILHL
jgi:hypothetical protein